MITKILITGDFCPIGRNAKHILNKDHKSLYGDFCNRNNKVDLSITNLESPITESSNPIEKSGPNIKLPYGVAESLNQGGFNLVTLANNHILDYGAQGIQDTLDSCNKNGIDTVGAANNLTNARKPYFIELNNKIFAIINIAENEFCTTTGEEYGANPLNVITNHYDIKESKQKSDYVIVISHGGREHYQLPTPKLRERYRFFIESGADVVVGHHTHTFSGYEEYKGKKIFYSLGNFIFDYKNKYQKGKWTQGFAVELLFNNDKIDFELIAYNQGREDSHNISILNKEELKIFESKFRELSEIVINDKLFYQNWDSYIKSQEKRYKSTMFLQNKYFRELVARNIIPPIYLHSNEHKNVLLNILRCETHREIMIDVLSKKNA